ncbi:MAG: hypothetical protein HYY25_01165 [Candidatus Wallbacteria bacterium]|nr:hypothetical protein [Candidatus Wallbacteria bacterium]
MSAIDANTTATGDPERIDIKWPCDLSGVLRPRRVDLLRAVAFYLYVGRNARGAGRRRMYGLILNRYKASPALAGRIVEAARQFYLATAKQVRLMKLSLRMPGDLEQDQRARVEADNSKDSTRRPA